MDSLTLSIPCAYRIVDASALLFNGTKATGEQDDRENDVGAGGTGKTGRRVAERLRARNRAVRMGSRFGEPPFDWEKASTWPAALRDVGQVYLLEPLLAGEVALPAGHVGEPFVDADDIADVAIAALTQDGHVGRLYELSGPRLWTFAEAIAEIARVTHRDIRYVELSIEEYASALEAAELPPDFVTLLKYLFTEVLDGRNAWVADGVTHALGRRPRDFTEYVRDAAATGVWKVGDGERAESAAHAS